MWWKSAVFVLLCLVATIRSQEISCNYINRGAPYPYTCQLTIDNPEGLDDFTTIPGTHVEGFTDADVLLVDAFGQNTLNVPAILCQQFPNVRDMYLAVNGIEIVGEAAFAACANVEAVILLLNSINRLPSNTFRNNPNLQFIYFNWNGLEIIEPNAFTGKLNLET